MENLLNGLFGSLIGALVSVLVLFLANWHASRQFKSDLDARRVERELPVIADMVRTLANEIGRDHLDSKWCESLRERSIFLNLHARDKAVEAWRKKSEEFGQPAANHPLFLAARMHVLSLQITAQFPNVVEPKLFKSNGPFSPKFEPILTTAYTLGATRFDDSTGSGSPTDLGRLWRIVLEWWQRAFQRVRRGVTGSEAPTILNRSQVGSSQFNEVKWSEVRNKWTSNSKIVDEELERLIRELNRWPSTTLSDQEEIFDTFVDRARRIATSILVCADLLVGGTGDICDGLVQRIAAPESLARDLSELITLLKNPHYDQQRMTLETLSRGDDWYSGELPDPAKALNWGGEFEISIIYAGSDMEQPYFCTHFVQYRDAHPSSEFQDSTHLVSLASHWPLELRGWVSDSTLGYGRYVVHLCGDGDEHLIDETIAKHFDFLWQVHDLWPPQTEDDLYLFFDGESLHPPTLKDLRREFAPVQNPKASAPTAQHDGSDASVNTATETPEPRRNASELARYLQTRVKGQRHATDQIAERLILTRQNLDIRPERPNGVFLFVGPTGVGKTELAREIAFHEYGSYDRLIRVDMSELADRSAVSRLIGPHPGYVGSDDPSGWLTTRVAAMPQCVVLLDEVEKAHLSVWNTFLQVFDAGQLTDGRGRSANFKDALIIMTSNLGSATSATSLGFGKPATQASLTRERVHQAVKDEMPPELLNRIDDIVLFDALSAEVIAEIAHTAIDEACRRLAENGRQLTITPGVIDWLAQTGYNPAYGARHLQRAIERELLTPVAKAKGPAVTARIVDGRLAVTPT